MQNYVGQPQTVQVPNYSGVNIQIINPTVSVPGAGAPVYNVNSPTYQSNPNDHYPAGYYINQWGSPLGTPPNLPAYNSTTIPPVQTQPACQSELTVASTQPANGQNGANGVSGQKASDASNAKVQNSSPPINASNTQDKNDKTVSEDKDTKNSDSSKTDKNTEKRKIVQLTDDYIKTLENYLNSQDKEVRLMGAKEVVARLMEDESRKDDKALTALINKMMQDPSQQVKFLALSMLDSRNVTGDNTSVKLLKEMQKSKSGFGQDALLASNILLKMSGKTVEKEFEVKDDKKKTKT